MSSVSTRECLSRLSRARRSSRARVVGEVADAREGRRVLVELDVVEEVEAHLAFALQVPRPAARPVARAQRGTRALVAGVASRIAALLLRLADTIGLLGGRLGTRGGRPTSYRLRLLLLLLTRRRGRGRGTRSDRSDSRFGGRDRGPISECGRIVVGATGGSRSRSSRCGIASGACAAGAGVAGVVLSGVRRSAARCLVSAPAQHPYAIR